jgi:hypothetical protein
LPGARLEGKTAIAAFYDGRKAQGPRTSVHIVNNFFLVEFTSDVARTRGIVSLVAGDCHPPLPSAVPLLITAAEMRYIKIESTWKVQARLNVPQFVDQASGLSERIAAAQHLGSASPS